MNRTLLDVMEGLRCQPARTCLALFSVAVGMAALTVLLAVTGGLRERSRTLSEAMGSQVFAILPDAGADSELTRRDSDRVAANLPDAVVSTVRRSFTTESDTGKRLTIVGTDGNLAAIRGWSRIRGRFLDGRDVKDHARVAIVTASRDSDPRSEPGQIIVCCQMPFTIVGEVEAGPVMSDTGLSESPVLLGGRTVFIPYTAAMPGGTEGDKDRVDAILVHAGDLAKFERIMGIARRLLAQERPRAAFQWVTADTLIEGLRRLNTVIGSAVGAVALLCILLGGTTLVSLMAANVRDRIPEIGLRRALGARPGDIALLFVMEACLVTGVAAVAGTAAAHAALEMLGPRFPVPVQVGIVTVFFPTLTALLLGGLFAFWPARLAATILPADALRSE